MIARLLTLAMVTLSLAGCGGGDDDGGDSSSKEEPERRDTPAAVPEGAVAVVGDTEISRTDFDHWLRSAALAAAGGGKPVVPDPPEFGECVEAKRKDAPRRGDEKLRDACRDEYEALRDQVMQFLLSGEWIEQEAEQRGIEAGDEEVRQQFEDQKKQSFPKEADYREFLRSAGQTEEDILHRVRLDVLSNKLREEVVAGEPADEEQDALENWVKDFQGRYRARTVCAEGFVTPNCSNGEEDDAPQPPPGGGGFFGGG